ncbi:MAG: class II fructose-bisphosphate aldolase [Lachnospiraceae bacterium]|jgi:ketose-bisphosphate aldolase|nr:class II fructose-bisphosphate aldolase [Lachnospiraceae bacterium]
MALVKVNELLKHATEHHYGVAAVNVINVETVKYIIEAAESERVPVIVQFYPGFDSYIDMKYIAHAATDMARYASVPVAVHLDHSAGYEIAMKGLKSGFPSVMVDGSSLPFEENIELTASIVRAAEVFGVDVEAELGHVGSGANENDIVNTNHYTKVDQAVEFVERTGCGSLAIAVGNAHGPYVKTPNLDFERIRAIRAAVSVPLVLHGCSDIPEDQIREAVNLGMSKFNVATEYFRIMYQAAEKTIAKRDCKENGVGLLFALREPMIDFVIQKIRLLNPNRFSL